MVEVVRDEDDIDDSELCEPDDRDAMEAPDSEGAIDIPAACVCSWVAKRPIEKSVE